MPAERRISVRTMLRPLFAGLVLLLVFLVLPGAAYARVTEIDVDDDQPLDAGYHQISGRAFGELDPNDALNAIIQDIQLGVSADGKVHYVASFVLTLPNDLPRTSGMLWHDVPTRGTPIQIGTLERSFGDIGLASAWQGDNAGIDANNGTSVRDSMLADGRHWLQVPIAHNPDGSSVTGRVLARM